MTTIPAPGQKVLLLWAYYVSKNHLNEIIESLQKAVEDQKLVAVESFETLVVSDHASSSFDVVFCGALTPTLSFHPAEVFAEIVRILKPGGTVIIRESVSTHGNVYNNIPTLRTAGKLASALKLSGFINVSQPEKLPVTETNVEEYEKYFQNDLKDVSLIEIRANKPSFEIGASVPLSTPKKAAKSESNAAKIWMLSTDDALDENVELINEDDLLDDDDLKKPDPSTLRVCATTQKRKACKNCTCGLAEELEQEATENIEKNKSSTSACGNCYLGDAFRCASCPYLGMPAFKPGEKITLTDNQLKADV